MNTEQIAAGLRNEILSADRDKLIFNDFQKALPALRDTELYRMFRAMPKGRLMHGHIEATFDLRYVVELALTSNDTYVHLAPETADARYCQMAHKAWFPNFEVPGGWVPMREAVQKDPSLLDTILKMCSSDKENIDENIWPKFEAIFDRFKAINNYRPFFVKIYTEMLSRMAREGLLGVDFRYISQSLFDETGRVLPPEAYVDTVKEIEAKVREQYPWFTVRLIYCYYKGVPVESVPERLEFARTMIEKYPGYILGFDMVGDEDCGKDLMYYAPVLRNASVPIIMHAGESVDPDNRTVEYALDLGIKRIGHGMNLYRYPELIERVRESGMMLEVCPLSNQLLGYVPDLTKHPGGDYIRKGLNVTISSDDCAIFGTSFITDDLLLAYLCWDLTLADIKRVLLNSLQDDKQLTALFLSQWSDFERATLR